MNEKERAIRIYSMPENRKMKTEYNLVSITEKIVAQQVEKIDDFICESIIRCLPEDVTKVLFLDKNMIVGIFEKQVPKQVKDEGRNLPEGTAYCPSCGAFLSIYHKYCFNCGQALEVLQK